MNDLQKVMSRAEFFPRGHIIPRRVFKLSRRKYQHLFKFGSDSWVLPGKNGYVVIQRHERGMNDSAIFIGLKVPDRGPHCWPMASGKRFTSPAQATLNASPYHKSGDTYIYCGLGMTEQEHFDDIREHLLP